MGKCRLSGKEGVDLRDPKLSITPDGRLMVIIRGSLYHKGKLLGRSPHVSFSDPAGMQFTSPEKVEIDPEIASWGDWIWRVTWYKGTCYAVDYQIGSEGREGPTAMYLVQTKNGKASTKVSQIKLEGYLNEAIIRFDENGTMYVLIQRELGDQMGVWAKSPPYDQFEFKQLELRLDGPNFISTHDGTVIAGTRVYELSVHTSLFTGDRNGNLRVVLRLPFGGDTIYPGLLPEEDRLLVSYYSSHEDKTAI